MSLLVTKKEAMTVCSTQYCTIIRAHRKIHYKKGDKVPLVVDRVTEAVTGYKIIQARQMNFGELTCQMAKDAGFRNLADFRNFWKTELYGSKGLQPCNGFLSDDTKIVIYVGHKDDYTHKKVVE